MILFAVLVRGATISKMRWQTSAIVTSKYLFISTHSQRKHAEVLGFLRSKGYRIIGSSDLTTQTFSFDGVVIAVHASNTDVPEVELGSRAHTPIRETMFSSVPTVPTCKYLPDAALRNLTANGS